MGVAYSNEKLTGLAAAVLLLLSLSLGGCATSTTGSSLMDARAEAPMPSKANGYLPVEDLPPPRESPVMTPDERSKLKSGLLAARDRTRAGPQPLDGQTRAGPPPRRTVPLPAPVEFQNLVTCAEQQFHAARSYSLIKPPRTGRHLIRL